MSFLQNDEHSRDCRIGGFRAWHPPVDVCGMLAFTLLSIGCHKTEYPQVFPVSGNLRVNGIPAANASLAFHPLDRDSDDAIPSGKTNREGVFNLAMATTCEGAPVGMYAVTIVWPSESPLIDECECSDPLVHDQLKGLYADRELTEIRVRIRPTQKFLQIDARGPPVNPSLIERHG